MRSMQRTIGPLTLDIPVVLIGLQILLKGIAKLEGFSHHPFIVTSLFLLGAFVLSGAVLPLWLEKHYPRAHALFHVAEGVAVSLSAIILFEKGKLRIPIILLCTGILYVLVGYLESRPQAQRERLAGPMLRGIGVAFLLGGVSLALFTFRGDRDAFALGVAGLFVLIGGTLLLGSPWILRRRAARARAATEHAAAAH